MAVNIPKAYRVFDMDIDLGVFYARNPSAAKYKAYCLAEYDEFCNFKDCFTFKARRAPEYDEYSFDPDQFDWIKETYSVPAAFGTQVIFNGKEAVILGTRGHYLELFDGKHEFLVHPTWRIKYLDKNGMIIWKPPSGSCDPVPVGGDAR